MVRNVSCRVGILFVLVQSSVSLANANESFWNRTIHPSAPPEVHHWGTLMGDWDVRWEAYTITGVKRNEGTATWHWYATLGGFAIQDFFTHAMPADIGRDRVGTNVRVFDASANEWHIRWTHNFGAGFEEFTAIHSGPEIIMYEDGNEEVSRIRFFEFQKNSFRQQEEKSDDGGKNWYPTFKAWATRQPT